MKDANTFHIRQARPEDAPRLMELIRELAAFERQPDAVTVTLEDFIADGFGPQAVWEAIVAETDGEIIGMSLFYIRYSTWKGKRLYLEDLIVQETYRGLGVGKSLFEETLKICKERGYSGMVWQALDWNEPALAFYRKYNATFDSEWINISIETPANHA
jgi:ribosomal protein S18 acetylase RimI-like enzyme